VVCEMRESKEIREVSSVFVCFCFWFFVFCISPLRARLGRRYCYVSHLLQRSATCLRRVGWCVHVCDGPYDAINTSFSTLCLFFL
jgi:hypothetical protein